MLLDRFFGRLVARPILDLLRVDAEVVQDAKRCRLAVVGLPGGLALGRVVVVTDEHLHVRFPLLTQLLDPVLGADDVELEPVAGHLRVDRSELLLSPGVLPGHADLLRQGLEFLGYLSDHDDVLDGVLDERWVIDRDLPEAAELLGHSLQVTDLALDAKLERLVVQGIPFLGLLGLGTVEDLLAVPIRVDIRGRVHDGCVSPGVEDLLVQREL